MANKQAQPKDQVIEYKEGEVISGRFKLLKQLGRGAFGVVHEAIDVKTSKACAIKVITWKLYLW